MLLGTSTVFAASYTDETRKFVMHMGPSSTTNTIIFNELDSPSIRQLARYSKDDSQAKAAFEKELFQQFCTTPYGTIDYNVGQQVKITCTNGKGITPIAQTAFLRAHCAGFCTLHGKGFKKYEYNKSTHAHDCICKAGNALNFTTSESQATTTTDTGGDAAANVTPDTGNTSNTQKDEEKAKRKAENQAAKDQRKAEKAQESAEKRAAKEQQNQEKQAAKEKECAAKNPPQVAKKNFLGKWICADSDATVAEREQKKATNKTLKTFWDDMDDLDKAFQKKIKQLQKNGGAK